jgi:hypothetical protein
MPLSPIYTFCSSLQHTLSLLCQLSLNQFGNVFQRRTFLSSWVPELSPCLSLSNSWLTVNSTGTELQISNNPIIVTNWIGAGDVLEIEVEVEVNLQPIVSRPVCLGVGLLSGAHDKIFLFSVWQLQVSWCGAPSLTRGLVCNLLVQLLPGLARAVTLESKSRRTQTVFCCLIWDSPSLECQVPPIYIPQEQGGPVIPPGTGFPFCRLLRLAGLRWRYSNQPPHGSGNRLPLASVYNFETDQTENTVSPVVPFMQCNENVLTARIHGNVYR